MQESKKDILRTVTRYAQAGDWLKVIKEYQKLLKMDANDISLYNSIGDALVKLNENRKAFECYVKVLNHYQSTGNITKIPFLYKKIAKLNPRKFDLEGKALYEKISKIVQAVAFYDKEDYTRAFPYLKEASKLDGKNVDIMVKLGETAEKQMLIGDAVEAYVNALRLYIGKDKVIEALDIAKKVLNLDKTNIEASAMIAEDLIRKNKKQEAEEMYRDIFITLAEKNAVKEGIEISKRATALSITYGKQFYAYFLFKDEKIEEAKKLLEGNYDLTAEDKVLLGKIYYKSGEFENAKNVLLAMDPGIINENSEILELVGDVFLKMDEHKKAGEYYLKGVRLLREHDMLDHAIMMSNKVKNVDDENIELHEILVDIYSRKSMKNQLIDEYEHLAKLYDREGRTEEVLKIQQTLSKLKMI